jgi:tetratricopeptide (TPR) repeat protein
MKRFSIRARLFLLAALAGTVLCTALGYADPPDADLVKQGTAALKHRDYDIAIAKLSDAIRLAPSDADAWGRRGEAYAAKGKSDKAVADCAQAVKLAPSSGEAYGQCGYVYLHANDFGRAIEAYSAAIKLDPRHASAYSSRGLSYSEVGQTDRAISDYDTAIQLDPSQSDVYVLRGNAWFMKGKFGRARADYDQALKVDPKNAYAYLCRGVADRQRYAYDEAIADYNKAISIDPNYKDAYRYRDEALQGKSNAWWGPIYLFLMGVGVLALLFAAFWTYISPTAFRHGVDRHFKRMPDGSLVFYPRLKGVGYVVPDAEKETALRSFAKDTRLAAPASGILWAILFCVLVWPFQGLFTSQLLRLGISTSDGIFIYFMGSAVLMLLARKVALSRWRRAAVRGLARASEKGELPKFDLRMDDLINDMPVPFRWVALAFVLFLFYWSFKGQWIALHEFSFTRIGNNSIVDWLGIPASIFWLWYGGRLLNYAVRRHQRGIDQTQKAA